MTTNTSNPTPDTASGEALTVRELAVLETIVNIDREFVNEIEKDFEKRGLIKIVRIDHRRHQNMLTDLGKQALAAARQPATAGEVPQELEIVCHTLGDEEIHMLQGYGVSRHDIFVLDTKLWNDFNARKQELEATANERIRLLETRSLAVGGLVEALKPFAAAWWEVTEDLRSVLYHWNGRIGKDSGYESISATTDHLKAAAKALAAYEASLADGKREPEGGNA